jgi:hypothetical protein
MRQAKGAWMLEELQLCIVEMKKKYGLKNNVEAQKIFLEEWKRGRRDKAD